MSESLTLAEVIELAANLRERGPWPVAVRIAPDVWSALRRDQYVNRPLPAPPPMLSVPVHVVDDLPAGQWRLDMSDGTVRSSEDPT